MEGFSLDEIRELDGLALSSFFGFMEVTDGNRPEQIKCEYMTSDLECERTNDAKISLRI